MKKGLAFFVFLIIVGFATFSFASRKREVGRFHFIPVVDVYRVKVEKKVAVNIVLPGRVKSVNSCLIRAKVSGTLLKRMFKDGEFVRRGDILFEIDPSLYRAAVNELKARLGVAKVELENAKVNYERIEKSFRENLVSRQQRDNAFFALKRAEANLNLIKTQIKKAEIYVSYTKVKAPISGFVGERLVDVGSYVQVNEPLVRITKLNPIYVDFSIADTEFFKYRNYLRNGLKVELLPYGEKGHVDFVAKVIDPHTATVKMRAVFENSKHSLLPNEFVMVKLAGVYDVHAEKIPKVAVIQTAKFPMVYVIKKGRAEARPIKIIGEKGKFFIVKGIKNGSLIAYDNLMRIRPGAKVKVGKIINK